MSEMIGTLEAAAEEDSVLEMTIKQEAAALEASPVCGTVDSILPRQLVADSNRNHRCSISSNQMVNSTLVNLDQLAARLSSSSSER